MCQYLKIRFPCDMLLRLLFPPHTCILLKVFLALRVPLVGSLPCILTVPNHYLNNNNLNASTGKALPDNYMLDYILTLRYLTEGKDLIFAKCLRGKHVDC